MSRRKLGFRFIPIPLTIIDQWVCELSGSELKCYLAIARKTWGYNKHRDAISLSQMQRITGLSKSATAHAISSLTKRGLLRASGSANRPKVYEPLMAHKDYLGDAFKCTTEPAGDALESTTVMHSATTTIDCIDSAPKRFVN